MPTISPFSQIPDYDALVAEVKSYLNRNDLQTVNNIPLFINNAEKLIKRQLRMPSLEKMVELNFGDDATEDGKEEGWLYLPQDYLEMKDIWTDSINNPVMSRSNMNTLLLMPKTGREPAVFARSADRLYFRPIPTDTLTISMTYYLDLPETGPENPSSPIYELAHDVWLYFSVAEGFRFLYEQDKAEYWKGLGDERLAQIHAQVAQAEYSGAPIRIGATDIASNYNW